MTVDEARALLIAYTRPAKQEALDEAARDRDAPRIDVHPCPRCRGYGDVRKGGPRGTVRGLEVCGKCEGAGWISPEGA